MLLSFINTSFPTVPLLGSSHTIKMREPITVLSVGPLSSGEELYTPHLTALVSCLPNRQIKAHSTVIKKFVKSKDHKTKQYHCQTLQIPFLFPFTAQILNLTQDQVSRTYVRFLSVCLNSLISICSNLFYSSITESDSYKTS